ncbi:MAG: hypothetical protein R3B36_00585 [Polyangiaceae bacterium]
MLLTGTAVVALGAACALVGCGGAPATVSTPPASAVPERARGPGPPPTATAPPPDCNARAGHDGPCFPSAEEACRALACAPPTRCSIGASLPPVVTCGPPDEAMDPK